jgi:hypothetical protein
LLFLLVRRQRCPNQNVHVKLHADLFLQAREIREKQISQRPIQRRLAARWIMLRDGADDQAEVAEVSTAALSVAGAFSLWLEEFGEVAEDPAPNRKKSTT